jgi:hypothetical protein
MPGFPFKTLTCYSVLHTFTSPISNDIFKEGSKVTYLSSTLNHYDDIEICKFRDIETKQELVWHAHPGDLDKALQFFRVIPWPA